MNSVIDIAQELFWKRLGLADFTFFLVNGLMWLVVPGVMFLMGSAGQ